MATDIISTPQSEAEQSGIAQANGEQLPEQLNFQVMEAKIRQLIGDWAVEIRETKLRRAQRKLDVDLDSLRQGNAQNPAQLNADETLIPVRVIDENIRKEHPMFVQYLTQSRRLGIFDNPQIPQEKREKLEIAFTKGMMYSGFLRGIYKEIDGASLHAWDAVEIMFSTSKPLNCAVEHIGHENLIFARDSKDIQGQEFILRKLDVTTTKLEEFQRKHGFDPLVVKTVIDNQASKQVKKNICIYKYFTKIQGIVYVGWCTLNSEDGGTQVTNWLKKPELLDLGRRVMETKMEEVTENVTLPDPMTGLPISVPTKRLVPKQVWTQPPEDFYPIKIYLYSESEEQCITDQKGRAFFDNPSQEAQTALYSLFVNGAVRASNVYAAVDEISATGAPLKKIDASLEHGCIYDRKMNFFHTDYPDPAILRAADSLNVRKAQEMGQAASAVINREDSRKTAQELKQARAETEKMGQVPIMLFSNHMREVLTICWYIVQSQAEQNNIILLPIEVPIPSQIPGGMPSMQTINDMSVISAKYDIKPAGDVDVLKREEKIQKRFMMLPIVQPTSLYPKFLMDFIAEMFPEEAEEYNAILQQGMAGIQQQMIAMAQMLQEATTDESGAILPEWKKFEGELQQMFSMIPQQMGSQQAGQQTTTAKPTNEQSNNNAQAAA